MGAWTLILAELRYRRLASALALASVMAAIGCLIATLLLLREHGIATAEVLASKQEETRRRLELLTDDMRKITVRMGFNILILPKDQNLGDFYADDYASKLMPEDYASRLARSGIATINHILPSLQRKLAWSEGGRTVLLAGTRGEVVVHSPGQKQLLPTVRRGEAILGYELHHALRLERGAAIQLSGHALTVAECRPSKGTKDDITIWVDLAEAQEMLGEPGRINAILALECNCAAPDRLGQIRADVERILPDTQVLEYQTQALARAEARNRAEAEAEAAFAQERATRERLEADKARLAALVVPLVLAACAAWIAFLSWQNVRERRIEIAVLRAVGVATPRLLMLLLARAAALGLAGGALGYAVGLAPAAVVAGSAMRAAAGEMLSPAWLAAALAAGPLFALAAAWLPALLAARQDPADILREA
jgi:hypothetical protein